MSPVPISRLSGLACIAACVSAAALSGCSSCSAIVSACGSGKSVSFENPYARQLVGPPDLAKYPATSPARALLAWWRDIQYNNLAGYLAGYDAPLKAVRSSTGLGQRELSLLSGQLQVQKPLVLYTVRTQAGSATIYALISIRAPLGTRDYRSAESPHAFTMVLEGGRWRLADDGFAGTFLLAEHKALASPKTSVLVPDVTGMPASVASIELFGANLVAQPEGPSTDRAGGVVVQQSVAPGTPVARGSTIRLSATP
jgi:hypothetical protein